MSAIQKKKILLAVQKSLRGKLKKISFALKHDVALPLPSSAIEPHGNLPQFDLLSRWETVCGEMHSVSIKNAPLSNADFRP